MPNLGIASEGAVTVEFWLKDGPGATSMLFGFFEYDLMVGDD
jgi:hypothetical protein